MISYSEDVSTTVDADRKTNTRDVPRSEGGTTKQIELMSKKIPSVSFLGLAFASIGLSALLQLAGKKRDALFVGQWAPTILVMGLYNRLVKAESAGAI